MASCHPVPGCAFHGSQGKARITAGQSLATECHGDGDSSVEPTGESAQQHPFGVHCLELCQIPLQLPVGLCCCILILFFCSQAFS